MTQPTPPVREPNPYEGGVSSQPQLAPRPHTNTWMMWVGGIVFSASVITIAGATVYFTATFSNVDDPSPQRLANSVALAFGLGCLATPFGLVGFTLLIAAWLNRPRA